MKKYKFVIHDNTIENAPEYEVKTFFVKGEDILEVFLDGYVFSVRMHLGEIYTWHIQKRGELDLVKDIPVPLNIHNILTDYLESGTKFYPARYELGQYDYHSYARKTDEEIQQIFTITKILV